MLASELRAQDQIREARLARGEDVETVARRAGVRPELVRAIEDGRFADLPPGVYARAAIRACATALGLPGSDIVLACEPLLPAIEDPVVALARLCGVRHASNPAPVPATATDPPAAAESAPEPTWRTIGAAAVDAAVVAALIVVAIGFTALACGVPPASFGRAAAPGFVLLGTVVAVYYFVLLGGIAGATAGDIVCGSRTQASAFRGNGVRDIASRTLACAAREAHMLQRLGARIRTSLDGLRSSS
jgi:helix-turn-helix protein